VTLWDVVRAGVRPGSSLYTPGRGKPVEFAELFERAERTAGQIIADLGGRVPRRVGLLLSNGEPWVRALLAVLRLGATAVPLPLPVAFGGADAYVEHIRRVADDAVLDAVLVDGEFGQKVLERVATALAGAAHGPVWLVDVSGQSDAAPPDFAPADRDLPAVIQYTSGSTSRPRGVVLSTGNVVASLSTMADRTGLDEPDRLSLWIPLFHDMGLFSLLTGVRTGGSVVLWRPADFVRKPMKWLAEFAALRGTGLPAPNFFYDHLVAAAAVEGIPDGLDLSAWRFAINGAEPVQLRTANAFTRTFAESGLRPDVMHPAYGLAEATLMVSFPELNAPVRSITVDRDQLGAGSQVRLVEDGRALVSCGHPVPGMGVRIANGTVECPSGTVGEIQISGPAVTSGYLNLPMSEQPITQDGWLRTGDLGFLLDSELYLVGRIKDLIIIRGQNYSAEDVEEIVRTTPGVDRRVCAAFATEIDGQERIVVLWETSLEPPAADDVAASIQARISEHLGLGAAQVITVPPVSIPHTTSGKVKRDAARRMYHKKTQGAVR
jgi:fatty-acyl-CoA synthase